MLANVYLNRDSVCMADDVENHAKSLCIDVHSNVANEIFSVAKNYLPRIAGRGHRWICDVDGVDVATIYGNCESIELTVKSAVEISDDSNILFRYISSTY